MAPTTAGQTYDYIIVGAGSAGCVLANRLSEDPDLRILVIEAGGHDRSPLLRIPLTWGVVFKNRMFDWGYATQPEDDMDGRRIEFTRGKVLGGSSSINAMVYARGLPEDYDEWGRRFGIEGWSHREVLPYFRKSEAWQGGASEGRGGDGPLSVVRLRFEDPLVDAFMEAIQACGYATTDDYIAGNADGFGPVQATLRRGARWSAASAYLRPALRRHNVRLARGAHVARIRLEGGRAVGVEVIVRGHTKLVRAEREVLVCAGVINSPQLLMLSGIGEGDALTQFGIPVVADLPGVGRNLHDHLACEIGWTRRTPGALHSAMRLDRLSVNLLRSLAFGTGMASQIPLAAVGLIRSSPDLALPDSQLFLAAAPMHAAPHAGRALAPYQDAFGIKGVYLTPDSRGDVRLASADPMAPPRIRQRLLSAESDRTAAREMFRRMRDIGEQEDLASFRAGEATPGEDIRTDGEIDAYIRRTAGTLHHPVGTCRMGREDDPDAVLDDRMRVRGVAQLRVVDAAAMPLSPRGPINAPVMMMAEKIADAILERHAPAV